MMGTFRTGDMLTLLPIVINNIRSGDVIVFRAKLGLNWGKIVHRVVCINSFGLVTRGDSCKNKDSGTINQDLLIGRVCYRERNNHISVVHGGKIGQIKGYTLNFYWGLRRLIGHYIKQPYAVLKNLGIVCRIWKPNITRIVINTDNGPLIQFVHNKRIIARSWPEQNQFESRKPWDLIINIK